MSFLCLHETFFCDNEGETNKDTGTHGENETNIFVLNHDDATNKNERKKRGRRGRTICVKQKERKERDQMHTKPIRARTLIFFLFAGFNMLTCYYL